MYSPAAFVEKITDLVLRFPPLVNNILVTDFATL